jgi:hypothetical protein
MLALLFTAAFAHGLLIRFLRRVDNLDRPVLITRLTVTFGLLERIDRLVLALRENRSIANMIEVLIRRHCKTEGIPIPEQQTLFKDEDDG